MGKDEHYLLMGGAVRTACNSFKSYGTMYENQAQIILLGIVTNPDARIGFFAKFYIGTMLILHMPLHFFSQAAVWKKRIPVNWQDQAAKKINQSIY